MTTTTLADDIISREIVPGTRPLVASPGDRRTAAHRRS